MHAQATPATWITGSEGRGTPGAVNSSCEGKLPARFPAPMDLFVAHGKVGLAVDLDVRAGIITKADVITGFKVNRVDLPGDAVAQAGAHGHDNALVQLFLLAVGNDNLALLGRGAGQPAN